MMWHISLGGKSCPIWDQGGWGVSWKVEGHIVAPIMCIWTTTRGLVWSISVFSSLSNFIFSTDKISRMFFPFHLYLHMHCPNCKKYLSKLQKTVSVQIAKCICPNCKMYLSKLSNVFVQISKYICLNCKIYLSKLPNVFVHISKCISLNCKMYLSKLRNVFFQISKCICPNCKLCLSKSQRFP